MGVPFCDLYDLSTHDDRLTSTSANCHAITSRKPIDLSGVDRPGWWSIYGDGFYEDHCSWRIACNAHWRGVDRPTRSFTRADDNLEYVVGIIELDRMPDWGERLRPG